MKKIGFLSLLLAMVLLLGGCVNPPAGPDDEVPTGERLVLGAEAASDYLLVRGDNSMGEEKQAFIDLYDMILKKTGISLKMGTDFKEASTTKEILIGNTKREASRTAMARLSELQASGAIEGPGYLIRVDGDALVVVGSDTDTLAMGVRELFYHQMKYAGGELYVARSLELARGRVEHLLLWEQSGSTYKAQYSDYIQKFEETQLLSFDTVDFAGAAFRQDYSLDDTYQREGDGAARIVITAADRSLEQLMWHNGAFDFAVEDLKRTTLKLWVFIEDDDKFTCDHDAGYGRQEHQTTLFFRALDSQGRYHAWNHTLTGNGWHEIELTFNVNNGIHEGFDYAHITGFGMMAAADVGTVVEVDDLRGVVYQTDYLPSDLPEGDAWISECESDALDGLIVQEWYGCSYDLEDKKFGHSSVRCEGDPSVNDFRAIFHVGEVEMTYAEDVLVFWMKVDDTRNIKELFIELNEDQDQHEYELGIPLAKLQEYGLSRASGEWSQIVIPLSEFHQNFKPEVYGPGEDITLNGARFVVTGAEGRSYVVHYDNIYLTTKMALGMK